MKIGSLVVIKHGLSDVLIINIPVVKSYNHLHHTTCGQGGWMGISDSLNP